MLSRSSRDAAKTRRHLNSKGNGTGYWKTEFIGGGPAAAASGEILPTAFLIEQDPDSEFRPHFHQSDQFQVVVAGSGKLGAHAVGAIDLHYAGAYSPYGPIRAGGPGLSYFTLRNGFEDRARYVPDSRGELEGKLHLRRETMAHYRLQGDLAGLAGIGSVNLIQSAADGLGASVFQVPPGAQFHGPNPASGRGQYWLLLNGGLDACELAGERLSCAFLYPTDSPFAATGGPAGAEVLVMQFPLRSE